jgi:hypothetical protein
MIQIIKGRLLGTDYRHPHVLPFPNVGAIKLENLSWEFIFAIAITDVSGVL